MTWTRILLYVLILILNGLTRTEAATNASEHFGISVEEILKHL